MDQLGVIYLATGRLTFVQMCILSMASLRRRGFKGPVAVVSDLPSDEWARMMSIFGGLGELRFEVIDAELPNATQRDKPNVSKFWKARLDRLSPFRHTLYLDCDTIICRDLRPLFKILGEAHSPLAMALDRAPTIGLVRKLAPKWGDASDWEQTLAMCGPDAPHYNSGVIYWEDDSTVHTMFRCWEEELAKCAVIDQSALARALHRTNIKPFTLPKIANVQTLQANRYERAAIRHFSGMKTADALEAMLKMHDSGPAALLHEPVFSNHLVEEFVDSDDAADD